MLSKYVPSGIKIFAETVSFVTTSWLPVSEGGLLNTAHHQEYLQLMDFNYHLVKMLKMDHMQMI